MRNDNLNGKFHRLGSKQCTKDSMENQQVVEQTKQITSLGYRRSLPRIWRSLLLGISMLNHSVSADILTLTDPSSVPVPPSTHEDTYAFPTVLLDHSNPIISLAIDYDGATSGIGNHAIVSANLMFDPSVTDIKTLSQTLFRYEALATFSIPVTDVSNASNPGFIAVHENTYDLTSLTWTATYLDGTQRVAYDGIIPEPSSVSLLFVGSGLFYLRRKKCA